MATVTAPLSEPTQRNQHEDRNIDHPRPATCPACSLPPERPHMGSRHASAAPRGDSMTYRLDPQRKAAQQWHKLLNQGQCVAVMLNGVVIATGRDQHDHHVKILLACHPAAVLVRVADQL
ncbi:hypothetical protein L1A31_004509 [Escherichia coli]|nr:hypothetical protein [Escherichia coli]